LITLLIQIEQVHPAQAVKWLEIKSNICIIFIRRYLGSRRLRPSEEKIVGTSEQGKLLEMERENG
jgi:hypothetical protein